MPSVQIKDVPPEVHRILRKRAGEAGQSMQEYLLGELKRQTEEKTLEEVLDRVRLRSGGSVSLAFAAEALREDRNRAA